MSERRHSPRIGSSVAIALRRFGRPLLVAVVAALGTRPCPAHVVPWLELSLIAAEEAPQPARAASPNSSRPAAPFEQLLGVSDSGTLLVSSFGGGSTDGAVRTGTTWTGQVTQHADTLAVGGTARDDNGWGATHVSLDASGMSYLNIVAQRNAGHAASTLSIQFEDYSLQTKVVSVSTSQFAFGAMTLVQVPLTGWTIDFGPSQITSWSLGGGSVGTVDFRMTFDSLSFTTTAIPEPATYAAFLALATLALAAHRRRSQAAGGQR